MAAIASLIPPPMNFNPRPEQLLTAAEERARAANEAVERVISEVQVEDATFENSILPLIQSENLRGRNDPPIGFLEEVSPFKDIRDASRRAQVLLSDSLQDVSAREDICAIVTAVLQKDNDLLDPDAKHYLRKQQRSLVENGFSIRKGPERERYQELRKKITALRSEINKMANENKDGLWVEREQLDGVPEGVIKNLTVGNEEGENARKLWLQLWTSASRAVKATANNSSLRRLVTVKESYRCSEIAQPMRELLILRDEAARLLGYSSYAAYQLEAYLIATPAKLEEFFSAFENNIIPTIRDAHEELRRVKKKYLDQHPQEAWDTPDKLFIWDLSFYQRVDQKKNLQSAPKDVREYYPFQTTFPQILDFLAHLFCIRFETIKVGEDKKDLASANGGESLTWHDDVMMFRVWDTKDNTDAFLGHLYYDVFKREGKANKGMCYSLQKVCCYLPSQTYNRRTSAC
jgi:metallopeptidase MepB